MRLLEKSIQPRIEDICNDGPEGFPRELSKWGETTTTMKAKKWSYPLRIYLASRIIILYSRVTFNASLFHFVYNTYYDKTVLPMSQSVWPDLAKFRHFGTILKVLGKILRDYFVFDKILILLCQKCFTIGQLFVVGDGQILSNNLAIWSHWLNWN